ncbi:SPOR domain-containing protein [Biformimicrobium ophioploci]|uniref:SPOR domain-containing protein n=1 Tax=Biformimicrobium ophioploci TaxID=3036711 RepID=A0ABQ6LZI0_9GAMM|nr:SPOR domain-containing protein [Microbulbifer sp. NKW57]GMG87469.1 SPOR domain-containing protein [Microbulbifer sp. NKW57]
MAEENRIHDGRRQRLVGALVLAALAVIFLPSLFDREGGRYIDQTSRIPPAPEMAVVEIAEPQRPVGVAMPPQPEELFQPDEADAEPVTETVESSSPVSPEPILDASDMPNAWVVQVASYRKEGQARELRDRLMGDGFRAYTRLAKTGKGNMYRVFVGPKVDRQAAVQAKRELDQLLKIDSLVLRFKA